MDIVLVITESIIIIHNFLISNVFHHVNINVIITIAHIMHVLKPILVMEHIIITELN